MAEFKVPLNEVGGIKARQKESWIERKKETEIS
jgi:hypothetical protein